MLDRRQSFFALGLTTALTVVFAGCQATGHKPGSLETRTAYLVKRKLTVRGRGTNPVPDTEGSLRAGQEAFSYYCVVCHGLDGQNSGVPFAEQMAPPVPSLDSPEVQEYTDAQLKSIIENGIFPSGMPASKGTLTDDEMWQIVIYLRHLPPKGSLGEPTVYSAPSNPGAPDGPSAPDSPDGLEPVGLEPFVNLHARENDEKRTWSRSHER